MLGAASEYNLEYCKRRFLLKSLTEISEGEFRRLIA